MPRGIKAIIADAVSKLPIATRFVNDLPSFQNVVVDKNTEWPILFIDEPLVSDGTITSADAIRETHNIRLLFLNRDTQTPQPPNAQGTQRRAAAFDRQQQDHDLVIAEMKTLSKQFIAAMYKNEYEDMREVKTIESIQWANIRNEFNANISGVALTMNVELMNSEGLC